MDKTSLFRQRVCEIVSRVPSGKVVTYGQVALLAGLPRAAREVGWIAHTGPETIPWQRVVNRFGGLAKGYPGGQRGHQLDLQKEGLVVRDDMTVNLVAHQWWPDVETVKRLELPPEVVKEINNKITLSRDRLLPSFRHRD